MDFSLNEDQKAIKDLANQIFSDRSTDNFQLEFSRNQRELMTIPYGIH